MHTVGVDLAAEAASTALAVLDWPGDDPPRLTALTVGVDDHALRAALADADKAGVDCPLGWPDPFVTFVSAHHHGHVLPPADLDGLAWRRTLSRRATDHDVHRATGLAPMAVAADRIAAVAMRGAGLLGALHADGRSVDRAGSGVVVECYPAAALKVWGLPFRSYKRAAGLAALDGLVTGVLRRLPRLDLGPHETLLRESDDAFDAFVCALVARAAAQGRGSAPPHGLREIAAREGWIVLPQCGLEELAGSRKPRPSGR